ncbi:hypothetical protein [Cypionkella sp. TWP1-2-1b2]|uniref:hypothetical protein n=1 Tax=Cypionkella sp. TWP1-2-1b2 TaxID=2804675 RepID=UPI003CF6B876
MKRLANHRLQNACAGVSAADILAPPQLDEFIVGDDAAARAADMAALGWSEADLMR